MQVLDYSEGIPGAQAIREAGYVGAVRYIGYPGNPKCTTREELADFSAHELGMALVHESTGGEWRGGREAGQAAARRARAHADAVGFPAARPIYFAIDQDVVSEDEFRTAMDYLRGAGDVLGVELVGVYGEHDVIARAATEGVATWLWQSLAWSRGQMYDGRHLYQLYGDGNGGPGPVINGIGCDINDVLQDDWGQHTLEGSMPVSQTDLDAIGAVVEDVVKYRVMAPNHEASGAFLFEGTDGAQRGIVDMLRQSNANEFALAGLVQLALTQGGITVDAVVEKLAPAVVAGVLSGLPKDASGNVAVTVDGAAIARQVVSQIAAKLGSSPNNEL